MTPQASPPDQPPFADAAERIRFSQAVDYLEQGSPQLVDAKLVDDYVARGLLRREADGRVVTTALGEAQHRIARGERSSEG